MKAVLVIGGVLVLAGGVVLCPGCGGSGDADAATKTTAGGSASGGSAGGTGVASGSGGGAGTPIGNATEYASSELLLKDIVTAYRVAPTMVDSVVMNYRTVSGNRQYRQEVALGSGHDAFVRIPPGYEITATGGRMYMTYDGSGHKYIARDTGGSPSSSLKQLVRGGKMPLHLALRWSDDARDHVEGLGLGLLTNPRIKSHALTSHKGAPAFEIQVEAENGKSRVWVDAERKLVLAAVINYEVQRQGAGGAPIDVEVTFDPRISDSLARAIGFDPGARMQVDELLQLHRTSVGEKAPDFELQTLEGETVTLSSLEGNMIVLDFWATWCGPCKKGLPLLEQFHKWAEAEGHPVKVFAVDIWERQPTDDAKIERVSTYWRSQNFTMPTLLDLKDESVRPYGFSSIPTTVIIAPDGTVAKIHSGYDPRMLQTLQREASEILGL